MGGGVVIFFFPKLPAPSAGLKWPGLALGVPERRGLMAHSSSVAAWSKKGLSPVSGAPAQNKNQTADFSNQVSQIPRLAPRCSFNHTLGRLLREVGWGGMGGGLPLPPLPCPDRDCPAPLPPPVDTPFTSQCKPMQFCRPFCRRLSFIIVPFLNEKLPLDHLDDTPGATTPSSPLVTQPTYYAGF